MKELDTDSRFLLLGCRCEGACRVWSKTGNRNFGAPVAFPDSICARRRCVAQLREGCPSNLDLVASL